MLKYESTSCDNKKKAKNKSKEKAKNKMSTVLVTIGGKTKTKSGWCREFGVSLNAVSQKASRLDITFEEALFSTQRRKKFMVGGVSKSLMEWCREFGISDNAVRNRMKRGMSLEQALKSEKVSSGGRRAWETIDGETKRRSEWYAFYGINRKSVERRMRKGMSFKDAVTKMTRKGKSTFRLLCESSNVADWRRVYARMKLYGWSMERALNTPPLPRDSPCAKGRHRIVVNGEEMTAQKASLKLGVSKSEVGYRIRAGWDVASASSVPPLDASSRGAKRWANERRRELAEIGVVF